MARDRYHAVVRVALESEGWSITHDPYTLPSGRRNLYVDLGAERLLAAERAVLEDERIPLLVFDPVKEAIVRWVP